MQKEGTCRAERHISPPVQLRWPCESSSNFYVSPTRLAILEKEPSSGHKHHRLTGDIWTVCPLEQPDWEGDGSMPHWTFMVLQVHWCPHTELNNPPFPQVLFTHRNQAFSRALASPSQDSWSEDVEKAPIYTWKRIKHILIQLFMQHQNLSSHVSVMVCSSQQIQTYLGKSTLPNAL